VWDERYGIWSTEFIDDLTFDKQKRLLQFSTRKLAPMAYLQSRCTDYPYKKWKLRAIENQKALLTISTKRIKLNIEIGAGYAKLIRMDA